MRKFLLLCATVFICLSSTSCDLFKNLRKDNVPYCSSSAFINTEEVKPIAPTTTSDSEFHKIAGTNVVNQHKVIRAYDNLRECWDYYIKPQ